jgi:hypothetical protein
MIAASLRRAVLGFLLVATLFGCTTTLGTPPKYAALSGLSRGQSTEDDVRRALGEPVGKGAMRTGKVAELRQVWSYEHAVASSSSTAFGILLVFFRDGHYDGHLWFTSDSLLEVGR